MGSNSSTLESENAELRRANLEAQGHITYYQQQEARRVDAETLRLETEARKRRREETRIQQQEELRNARELEQEKELLRLKRLKEEEEKREAERLMSLPEPMLVKKKHNFLREAMSMNRITANWSGITTKKLFNLVDVPFWSEEVQPIVQLFKLCNNVHFVNRIQRVENPFLLAAFLLRKKKMEANNASMVREEMLFHGTKVQNVEGICKHNFDWRRFGQNRGHPYGKGVSFSPSAFFACHYSDKESEQKFVIVARVLIGETHEGVCTNICPSQFDTSLLNGGKVIVKYDDNEFYPEYVITYSRKKFADNKNKTQRNAN